MTGSIVYYPGVWDLLHVGHVRALEMAEMFGDMLIVGVPSDEVVFADKGEFPIISARDRRDMLEAIWCVDRVEIYHELEFLTHLNIFRPQVLAVGENWGAETRHFDAETFMKEIGGVIKTVPYYREESTTLIKERIRGRT